MPCHAGARAHPGAAVTVPDLEAGKQVRTFSEKYQELFEFQRLFTSSLRRYLDAQQASLRATAHALGEDEAHALDRVAQRVEAQELEKELKVEVLQRRVKLLGALQELRSLQIQDLRQLVHQPQTEASGADSPPRTTRATHTELPGLHAELRALRQREQDLKSQLFGREASQGNLSQRLASSERALERRMECMAAARRLAERVKQAAAGPEVAGQLLQAALEVQGEAMHTREPLASMTGAVPTAQRGGSPLAGCPVAEEPAPPTSPKRHGSPGRLPGLLSLVLEEVGVASEQLASLSPLRSASSRGEETPSTRVHSYLSDVEVQRQAWRRSPAEESMLSSPPKSPPKAVSSDLHFNSHLDSRTDGIDLALTSFLRQGRNRLRRSLFSRVGHGLYRYGTSRLLLRLAQGEELEAAGEGAGSRWERLEDFLRKVEMDQSQRLRHARERAKVLRKRPLA